MQTTGIKFANKNSSRNEAVVVSDLGDKLVIRVWVNPTQRFRKYTEIVEKRWVGRAFPLSPRQQSELAAFA